MLIAVDVLELDCEVDADVVCDFVNELVLVVDCDEDNELEPDDVIEALSVLEPVVLPDDDAVVVSVDVTVDVPVVDGDVTSQPKNVPCA